MLPSVFYTWDGHIDWVFTSVMAVMVLILFPASVGCVVASIRWRK